MVLDLRIGSLDQHLGSCWCEGGSSVVDKLVPCDILVAFGGMPKTLAGKEQLSGTLGEDMEVE